MTKILQRTNAKPRPGVFANFVDQPTLFALPDHQCHLFPLERTGSSQQPRPPTRSTRWARLEEKWNMAKIPYKFLVMNVLQLYCCALLRRWLWVRAPPNPVRISRPLASREILANQ